MAHYVEHPTADETRNLVGRFRAQVLDVLRIDDVAVPFLAGLPLRVLPRHQARPPCRYGAGGRGLLDR
ncbi:hypothetical protein AB0J63_22405 [Streptosporangium canum]|uniref:hypothetical protein n=1 Tax=Streptosporangium canum TaxID=324952 RepID=UPI003445D607